MPNEHHAMNKRHRLQCSHEAYFVTHIQCKIHWGDYSSALRWRHNGRDSVSNHQPHDCLLNRLFRRRPKKTPKLRVTGLCVGKSPGTGEFPTQMVSYPIKVSIWWRHHGRDRQPVGLFALCCSSINDAVSVVSVNSLWSSHAIMRYRCGQHWLR